MSGVSRLDERSPRFSVVVPVKNSVHWLPELDERLRSLLEPEGGIELVWVDDCSTDGSFELLLDRAAGRGNTRVLRGPGTGPAGARNVGIAAAKGRFIAFADSDTLPERDWLLQAARILEEQHARAIEGAIVPWSAENTSPLIRNVRNEDGGRYMTANMVYERALLEEVEGFDETFVMPHFLEDTDLAFRVLDMGVEIPFAPEVKVTHREIRVDPSYVLTSLPKMQWLSFLARRHPERYKKELRPKVQTFRPGDAELVLALPLMLASARGGTITRAVVLAHLVVAVRRVIRSADVGAVEPERRFAYAGVSLVAPFWRLACLARGWIRFRKLAV